MFVYVLVMTFLVSGIECNRYVCLEDICDDEINMFCDITDQRCGYWVDFVQDCFTSKHHYNCTQFWEETFKKAEREKGCKPLGKITNGAHNGSVITNHSHRDVVKSTCSNGFQPVGQTITTCGDFGLWKNPLPKCVANICELPKELDHDWIEHPDKITHYRYDVTISYHCDEGFVREGTETTMYQADATCSTGLPSCVRTSDKGYDGSTRIAWPIAIVVASIVFFIIGILIGSA